MHIHDLVGIGLGPFNLGMACLSEPLDDLDAVFLERKPAFDWHPGMMLDGATLQTPFLADLVTLADPTSPLSFLNYLKQSDRLYPFYIRESFFPLRREYNDYCRWACDSLRSLRFEHNVQTVTYDDALDAYCVTATVAGHSTVLYGRHLVLGTGTTAYLPPAARELGGDAVHNRDYLAHKEQLQGKRSLTVIGSGQSAAEIYADLLTDIDSHDYQLNWVTRSPRFFPLEYTKLTLEMTSPDYIDYYSSLPEPKRYELTGTQKALSKGINADLINSIFDTLYEKSIRGAVPTRMLTNTSLDGASYDHETRSYTLQLTNREQSTRFTLDTEGLIFGTGYHYQLPDFIEPLRQHLNFDTRGRFDVARNYSIDRSGRRIFLQNGADHAHSVASPDLGMGAYRNSCILREIVGHEVYPVEKSIAFQEFGAPAGVLV